jgi:hypothetical protein
LARCTSTGPLDRGAIKGLDGALGAMPVADEAGSAIGEPSISHLG